MGRQHRRRNPLLHQEFAPLPRLTRSRGKTRQPYRGAKWMAGHRVALSLPLYITGVSRPRLRVTGRFRFRFRRVRVQFSFCRATNLAMAGRCGASSRRLRTKSRADFRFFGAASAHGPAAVDDARYQRRTRSRCDGESAEGRIRSAQTRALQVMKTGRCRLVMVKLFRSHTSWRS